MSMDAYVFRIPAADLEALVAAQTARPDSIDEYLFAERSGRVAAAPDDVLELHKDWHLLSYLLTGAPELEQGDAGDPRAFLLGGGGGLPLGPEGNFFAFPNVLVEAIDEALSGLTPESLRARWDPAVGRDVYPDGSWSDRPGAEWSVGDTLGRVLPALQEFVREAARRRMPLITFVNV